VFRFEHCVLASNWRRLVTGVDTGCFACDDMWLLAGLWQSLYHSSGPCILRAFSSRPKKFGTIRVSSHAWDDFLGFLYRFTFGLEAFCLFFEAKC
jgi:hypothetical protein